VGGRSFSRPCSAVAAILPPPHLFLLSLLSILVIAVVSPQIDDDTIGVQRTNTTRQSLRDKHYTHLILPPFVRHTGEAPTHHVLYNERDACDNQLVGAGEHG
jgi:hypothetical protein